MPNHTELCGAARSVMYSLALAATIACGRGIAPAYSHGANLGSISLGHFWSPDTGPADGITSVFGPIFNGGGDQATLLGITSPLAGRAGICIEKDGAIQWLENIRIAPSKALILAKWREHICLEGVARARKRGESFPIELDFGKAGKVSIDVHVGVEGD